MKSLARLFIITMFSAALSACIQIDTSINVRTDGSGTIEETFLIRKDLIQQMKKMVEGIASGLADASKDGEAGGGLQDDSDSGTKAEEFPLFDEVKLRENAFQKGEGVTFIGGSKIVTDDYEGYRAVYAFEDISKVKINQNQGENMPSLRPAKGSDSATRGKEYLTFSFEKGNPAELVIKSPKRAADAPSESPGSGEPSQNSDKPSEDMTAQVKHLFQGMKIGITVAVEGNIVDTNASFREGSEITLVEVDFGKVMERPELLVQLGMASKSMDDTRLIMQQIPGVKVEMQEEIRIRFENSESDTRHDN